MLRCTPVDPTGALVSWFGFHTPSTLILTVFVRVCLSADWAGTLVLCSSSSLLLLFRLAPFLGFCGFLGGLLSLGFFAPLFFVSWCGCVLGTVSLGLLLCLPALVVPSCRVSSGLGAFLVVLSSVCCGVFVCWFCFSCCCGFCVCAVLCSVALCVLLLVLGVVAVLPALSCCPLLPHPPWLVLWCLLVQTVLCWSLPPGIWLYLQRPGCHTSGLVCCGWLAPVRTPLHGNKGLGPVWGSALYTMLWVLIRCLSLLH